MGILHTKVHFHWWLKTCIFQVTKSLPPCIQEHVSKHNLLNANSCSSSCSPVNLIGSEWQVLIQMSPFTGVGDIWRER